jgi:hypothetical protein
MKSRSGTYRKRKETLPPKRLCRNGGNAVFVILNEVKNLRESIGYKIEILRLSPQNDITTQSPRGKGKVRGQKGLQYAHPGIL